MIIDMIIFVLTVVALLGVFSGVFEAAISKDLSVWSRCFVVFSGVLAIIFVVYRPADRLMPYGRALLSALLGL